jgi:hypothetical protein
MVGDPLDLQGATAPEPVSRIHRPTRRTTARARHSFAPVRADRGHDRQDDLFGWRRHRPFLRKSSRDNRQPGWPGGSPSNRRGHARFPARQPCTSSSIASGPNSCGCWACPSPANHGRSVGRGCGVAGRGDCGCCRGCTDGAGARRKRDRMLWRSAAGGRPILSIISRDVAAPVVASGSIPEISASKPRAPACTSPSGERPSSSARAPSDGAGALSSSGGL